MKVAIALYGEDSNWWKKNKEQGITSLLFGYSLGKSQRIIKNINHAIGAVFVHNKVGAMNEAIRNDGGELPGTIILSEKTKSDDLKGNLIIAPPSITSSRIGQQLGPISTAMASGWILTGKHFWRSKIDTGFILSDHADWNGLLHAINDTAAEKVITMHGYTQELTNWLNEQGINSIEIEELRHQSYKL